MRTAGVVSIAALGTVFSVIAAVAITNTAVVCALLLAGWAPHEAGAGRGRRRTRQAPDEAGAGPTW